MACDVCGETTHLLFVAVKTDEGHAVLWPQSEHRAEAAIVSARDDAHALLGPKDGQIGDKVSEGRGRGDAGRCGEMRGDVVVSTRLGAKCGRAARVLESRNRRGAG